MSERSTRGKEHTDNPTDIKLTQGQVDALEDGGVLILSHALCGGGVRLWKEPQPDEVPA